MLFLNLRSHQQRLDMAVKAKLCFRLDVFTYLTVFLIVNCLSSPVLDDQLGQLDRQESHFWQWFDLHPQIFIARSNRVTNLEILIIICGLQLSIAQV